MVALYDKVQPLNNNYLKRGQRSKKEFLEQAVKPVEKQLAKEKKEEAKKKQAAQAKAEKERKEREAYLKTPQGRMEAQQQAMMEQQAAMQRQQMQMQMQMQMQKAGENIGRGNSLLLHIFPSTCLIRLSTHLEKCAIGVKEPIPNSV